MENIPKPQDIYRHFKGKLYQVVTLAKHSETGEELVIYQALYGDYGVYARPLDMFMERTDREKYPDADQEYRFERYMPKAGQEQSTDQTLKNTEKELPAGLTAFLDAEGFEKKLAVLLSLRDEATQDMLTVMGLSCDIELRDGSREERFEELKACLELQGKYECSRLR